MTTLTRPTVTLTRESFEITKLKVNERISEETLAFTATIVVDGVPLVDAVNRGHGGATILTKVFPRGSRHDELEAAVEIFIASLPKWVIPIGEASEEREITGNYSLDIFIDELVQKQHHNNKVTAKLKRLAKTQVIFRLPDDDPDTYRNMKHDTPGDRAYVRNKYPDAIIFNENQSW